MTTQEKIVVIRKHLEKMIECAEENPCELMWFSKLDDCYRFEGADMGTDFYMAMKGIREALDLSISVWCEVVALEIQARPCEASLRGGANAE